MDLMIPAASAINYARRVTSLVQPRQSWTVADSEGTELDIVRAVKAFRTGRGFSVAKAGTMPSSVRRELHIDGRRSEDDQRQAIRRLVKLSLSDLRQNYPDQASLVLKAFNLDEASDEDWLDRAQHLADSQHISRRTFIRRVDRALDLLAAAMAARSSSSIKSADLAEKIALARLHSILEQREDCRVQQVEVFILVDRDHVEVREHVTVEAVKTGAAHYVVGKTLPYKSTEITSEALSGAELLKTEQPHPNWVLELFQFDHALDADSTHRLVVSHDTLRMAPMWTATSFHEVEHLTVKVRFRRKPYGKVYAVEKFPPKLLNCDDIGPVLKEHAALLEINRLGEAEVTFSNLEYNMSYGVGWSFTT